MVSFPQLKKRLEDERKRLLEEIQALKQEERLGDEGRADDHGGPGTHPADDATDTFEQEKAVALERHLQNLLNEVEDALARFEKGTYGKCQRCGQDIDPERLEALPQATLCISCKAAVQNSRR